VANLIHWCVLLHVCSAHSFVVCIGRSSLLSDSEASWCSCYWHCWYRRRHESHLTEWC